MKANVLTAKTYPTVYKQERLITVSGTKKNKVILTPADTKYIYFLMKDKGLSRLCATCKRACANRTFPTFSCRGWKGTVWITRNVYDQIINVNMTKDDAKVELKKVKGMNENPITTITSELVDFSYEL